MRCERCRKEIAGIGKPGLSPALPAAVAFAGGIWAMWSLTLGQNPLPGWTPLTGWAVGLTSLLVASVLVWLALARRKCPACGFTKMLDPMEEEALVASERYEAQKAAVDAALAGRAPQGQVDEAQERARIESELRPQLEQSLRTELERTLRAEFDQQRPAYDEQALRRKLEEELRPELERRLRPTLEAEILPSLERTLRHAFANELRPEIEKELRSKIEAQLRPELERELRASLAKPEQVEREAHEPAEVHVEVKAELAQPVAKAALPTAPAHADRRPETAPWPLRHPPAAGPTAKAPTIVGGKAPASSNPRSPAPGTPTGRAASQPAERTTTPSPVAPLAGKDTPTPLSARPKQAEPHEGAAAPDAPAKVQATTDVHERARRRARVIVSDLSLYEKAALVKAAHAEDAKQELGVLWNDAVRSYNEAVPADVRASTNYLEEELGKRLAQLRQA